MVDRKRAVPSNEKQNPEQAAFEEWCRRAAAHAGTLISPKPLSAEQVLSIVTHNFGQVVTHQEYRMYCRGASEHAMAMYYAALLEATLASNRNGPEAVDFSAIIKRWEKRAGEMLVLDGPAEFAATYKAVYSSKPDHQIADELENLLGPAMAYGEQVKREIKNRGKLALVYEQFEGKELVEMVEVSYKEGHPPADAAEMIIYGAEYEKEGQDWVKARIDDPMQEMVGLIAYADAVIAELEKQGLRPYVQKTLPQTTWRGTIEAGYAQRLAPDTVATTLLNAANEVKIKE